LLVCLLESSLAGGELAPAAEVIFVKAKIVQGPRSKPKGISVRFQNFLGSLVKVDF
jgi:hypothetical protein